MSGSARKRMQSPPRATAPPEFEATSLHSFSGMARDRTSNPRLELREHQTLQLLESDIRSAARCRVARRNQFHAGHAGMHPPLRTFRCRRDDELALAVSGHAQKSNRRAIEKDHDVFARL